MVLPDDRHGIAQWLPVATTRGAIVIPEGDTHGCAFIGYHLLLWFSDGSNGVAPGATTFRRVAGSRHCEMWRPSTVGSALSETSGGTQCVSTADARTCRCCATTPPNTNGR